MHVFQYSRRPGTSAAHFDLQVDPSAKARRVQALMELAVKNASAFRTGFSGKVRPVLWESRKTTTTSNTKWSGLTDNYLRVRACNSSELTNQITLARLGKQVDGELLAEVGHALNTIQSATHP